jgi:hypothetical protein
MVLQSSYGRDASPVHMQQSRHPRARSIAGRVHFLLPLIVVLTLLGAPSAFAITREAVLARAQVWIDVPIGYSQAKSFGGYRTDCSGYVSMCWQTGTSWNTRSFQAVSGPIAVDQLKPGDALLAYNHHIRLFYGWVDAEHTRYVAYEQTSPATKSSIKYIADDLAQGYRPWRYYGIQDGPESGDALMNGTFNTWASGLPVWWRSGGNGSETVVAKRTDAAKAGRFSLQLTNSTKYTDRYVSLEQTASVTPDTPYALSAWALTAGDPRSLEMRLRYFDAAGASLADTRTTGAAWGIDATGFKPMSIPVPSPPGAVTALLTVRLAGAPARDASSTAGNMALLDEISLARPKATINIRSNATTTYIGRMPVLSGVVAPASMIGRNIVVYVRKPGRSFYSYSSARTVYTVNGGGAWLYKYYFKRGMKKGVYYFKAEAPPTPGILGGTSSVIAVRLR